MPATSDLGHARLMLRVARQVTARHDMEAVLAETLRGLRTVVEFARGSVQLLDDDGWVRLVASDPPARTSDDGGRMPLGKSLASRVILTEQPLYVPDVSLEPAHRLHDAGLAADCPCYFAVPLLADGRAVGLLQIDAATPDAFSETDQLLIASAAVIVAAAIQNARSHARASASRNRAERLERRLNDARRMISAATQEPLTTSPLRVSRLVEGLTEALGEPTGDIDLREHTRT